MRMVKGGLTREESPGPINAPVTMFRQTDPMPSLTLSDRLIWFAHCPKAGGTSVEQFMVATWGDRVSHLHWGWDIWWRDGGWRVADPPNSPQHLIWEDALPCLGQMPDAVFAVVREPAARMASEYRWQRRRRRGTRAGKALAWLPFSLWLRVMLKVAARNPHAFDNHLRPQADFVPDGARIFRLEDGLQPVADWLRQTAGISGVARAIPHAISTGVPRDIPARDAALIARVFQPDYARFGYARPSGPSRAVVLDWLATLIAPAVVFLDRRGRL